MSELTQEHKAVINQIIHDNLGIDLDLIEDESILKDDFGADSIDKYNLVYELEKEFRIDINDGSMSKILTVSDLYNTVNNLTNK